MLARNQTGTSLIETLAALLLFSVLIGTALSDVAFLNRSEAHIRELRLEFATGERNKLTDLE